MKVLSDGSLKEDIGTIVHRIYYKSGVLKEEGTSVNYLRHGTWKTYYESGVIKEECNYMYASLCGLKRTYHENGTIESESTFA
jgi:antitoxin component YwqK of YwqJK toxin-antitoxin module